MGACFWVWIGTWILFWIYVIGIYIKFGIPWERELKAAEKENKK